MKLAEDVLLEIMAVIQKAILKADDASQGLRDLDLSVDLKNERICLTRNLKAD